MRTQKIWTWLKPIGAVVLMVTALLLVIRMQGTGGPEEGMKVGNVELSMSDGSSIPLLSAQKPGFKILNFWATWCPACRAELPELRKYNHASAELIGVTMDASDTRSLKKIKNDHHLPYRLAIGNNQLSTLFNVQVLPTTVVVDPEGRVAKTFVGYVSRDDLDRAIKESENTY